MKPSLTLDRILPFVEEAAERFSFSGNIEDLAATVVEHCNNPSYFRGDDRVAAVVGRALRNEQNDYERRDLENCMADEDYSVWVAVRMWTAHSCRAAQDAFDGQVWKAGESLPVLPLACCPSSLFRCSYRPLSRTDLKKGR